MNYKKVSKQSLARKAISLVLAIMLVFLMLPGGGLPAFAGELASGDGGQQVNVDGKTVDADADADAGVLLEDGFADDPTGLLTITEGGWLTQLFGQSATNSIHIVNDIVGDDPYNAGSLASGDYIQFCLLQDSYGGDTYARFEQNDAKVTAINATVGQSIDLTITGSTFFGWGAWGAGDPAPVEDAAAVLVTEVSGAALFADTPLDVSDADGKVSFSFDTPGTYIVSAVNADLDYGYPLISPWLVVKVQQADTVSAQVSYQRDNTGFVLAHQGFDVSPGLAESYGYDVADELGANAVTALDFLVAAHIAVLGTDDPVTINAALEYSYGYASKIMNTDTSLIFLVNGDQLISASTGYGCSLGEAVIKTGDFVEFFVVQDPAWGDIYAWFEKSGKATKTLTGAAGLPILFTVVGNAPMWDDPAVWKNNAFAIADAQIVSVLPNGQFGTVLGTSDEDGIVALNLAVPGTYTVSIIAGPGQTPLMSSWYTIKVYATGEYPDDEDSGSGGGDSGTSNPDNNGEAMVAPNVAQDDALAYLKSAITSPAVSSVGGEWVVLAQARANLSNASIYNAYLANLQVCVNNSSSTVNPTTGKVVLDSFNYTENARVILALTALGLDAANVQLVAGGPVYDFVSALTDKQASPNDNKYQASAQGVNGDSFALIALNSGNYLSDNTELRDYYINSILSSQSPSGYWNRSVDWTAMALQALAPYSASDSQVKMAVDTALAWLSEKQDPNGTIGGSSPSTSQTVVALTALGINPHTDARFIKAGNSLIDGLLEFRASNGAFKQTLSASLPNEMATEQAAFALVAFGRFINNQNSLYAMNDANNSLLFKVTDSGQKPDGNPDLTDPDDGNQPSGGDTDTSAVTGYGAPGVAGIAANAATNLATAVATSTSNDSPLISAPKGTVPLEDFVTSSTDGLPINYIIGIVAAVIAAGLAGGLVASQIARKKNASVK